MDPMAFFFSFSRLVLSLLEFLQGVLRLKEIVIIYVGIIKLIMIGFALIILYRLISIFSVRNSNQ
jgi:hypothetical protein